MMGILLPIYYIRSETSDVNPKNRRRYNLDDKKKNIYRSFFTFFFFFFGISDYIVLRRDVKNKKINKCVLYIF